jgi:hypothetical protein
MSAMIRARFNGKVLVPEEPVDLPLDQVLDLERKSRADIVSLNKQEQAHAALRRLLGRAVQGANISDESLRRGMV